MVAKCAERRAPSAESSSVRFRGKSSKMSFASRARGASPHASAPRPNEAADAVELRRRLEVAEIMTKKFGERNKQLELALEEERARNPWAPGESGAEQPA